MPLLRLQKNESSVNDISALCLLKKLIAFSLFAKTIREEKLKLIYLKADQGANVKIVFITWRFIFGNVLKSGAVFSIDINSLLFTLFFFKIVEDKVKRESSSLQAIIHDSRS